MSTPSVNSVGTTVFTPVPGNDGALQYGTMWGDAYGTGVTLTYSFPSDQIEYFDDPYYDNEPDSWYALTSPEKSAVRSALAEWSSVANVTLIEVDDGENLVGDLRFAITDEAGDEAAHAYLPWDEPEGGDVWFKNGSWHERPGSDIKKGSYDYLTILHEIGHAIGLEHSFEEPQEIQKAYDNYAYTIMSYSASPFSDSNNASFYPTTPMYYDLVNIQGMYGRGVHNPGDTVYKYKDGKNYWQTIDDTGGTDTIVHKGSDKALIDLNVMHWSDLGQTIKFNHGSTKSTVAIGPETLIENATGGTGKDKIIGNSLANVLAGGGGKDTLTGGEGPDSFLFDVKPSSGNRDTIIDFTVGSDIIRLAQGVFSALSLGAVTAEAFDAHFDYVGGVLEYHGKAIATLSGAPAIDEGDLLVV
jgi:serralysin